MHIGYNDDYTCSYGDRLIQEYRNVCAPACMIMHDSFLPRLGRSVDGRVKITHLSDGFIKNFKKQFTLGKLVKAKVLK